MVVEMVALGEEELIEGEMPEVDGKALLMQRAGLSESDTEKVNAMLQRVAFMWMQEHAVYERG